MRRFVSIHPLPMARVADFWPIEMDGEVGVAEDGVGNSCRVEALTDGRLRLTVEEFNDPSELLAHLPFEREEDDDGGDSPGPRDHGPGRRRRPAG